MISLQVVPCVSRSQLLGAVTCAEVGFGDLSLSHVCSCKKPIIHVPACILSCEASLNNN
ncbi:mCG140238 [Mus musculus]|nr:mCG140238 [Mus musculus]